MKICESHAESRGQGHFRGPQPWRWWACHPTPYPPPPSAGCLGGLLARPCPVPGAPGTPALKQAHRYWCTCTHDNVTHARPHQPAHAHAHAHTHMGSGQLMLVWGTYLCTPRQKRANTQRRPVCRTGKKVKVRLRPFLSLAGFNHPFPKLPGLRWCLAERPLPACPPPPPSHQATVLRLYPSCAFPDL